MKLLMVLLGLMVPNLVFSSPHSGTLVKKKGAVHILAKPRVTSENRSNEILFMDKYFVRKKARIGSKLKSGEVLQTGSNGQAKILFSNGDSIAVGQGSSYLINKKSVNGKKPAVSLDLFYGKVRAIISQKGPRNQLIIKTPSAVAGVRGTDLHVAYQGALGSKISVLRGQVSVQPLKSNKNNSNSLPTKISIIETGQSAYIAPKSMTTSAKKIIVRETPKSTFIAIQKSSIIQNPEPVELSEKATQEIAILEKKSLANIIEDIKISDPLMAKKIATQNIQNTKALNTLVVADLFKQAPKEPAFTKPNMDELNELGEDVYKKYFK